MKQHYLGLIQELPHNPSVEPEEVQEPHYSRCSR